MTSTLFSTNLLGNSDEDFFQSFDHCWVFQVCWNIECNALKALSLRVLNISHRILSQPLALLTAVLPKVLFFTFQNVWLRVADHPMVEIWFICIFFCTILPCILFSFSRSVQQLLGLYCLWPLLCPSLGRMSFPCGLAGKESSCNVEDLGPISGLGRSPGEGNSYPL